MNSTFKRLCASFILCSMLTANAAINIRPVQYLTSLGSSFKRHVTTHKRGYIYATSILAGAGIATYLFSQRAALFGHSIGNELVRNVHLPAQQVTPEIVKATTAISAASGSLAHQLGVHFSTYARDYLCGGGLLAGIGGLLWNCCLARRYNALKQEHDTLRQHISDEHYGTFADQLRVRREQHSILAAKLDVTDMTLKQTAVDVERLQQGTARYEEHCRECFNCVGIRQQEQQESIKREAQRIDGTERDIGRIEGDVRSFAIQVEGLHTIVEQLSEYFRNQKFDERVEGLENRTQCLAELNKQVEQIGAEIVAVNNRLQRLENLASHGTMRESQTVQNISQRLAKVQQELGTLKQTVNGMRSSRR